VIYQKHLQEINIMLRSMFTAISSLGLHQTYLDVVADNLANANTTGFKASRLAFQNQFAQVLGSGSAPSEALGGVNPTQVGLGVQLGFITSDFTQGTKQTTGRNLDMAIEGDGFFIYQNGSDFSYSRDGALDIDSEGYLINLGTGQRIQGWTYELGDTTQDTNRPISSIFIDTNSTLAQATTNNVLSGNLKSTTPIYVTDPTDPTLPAGITTTTDTDEATVTSTFGIYDSLGVMHSVTVDFLRTGEHEWSWNMTDPAGTGSGTITFDESGQFDSATGIDSVTFAGSDGAQDLDFSMDLSNLTMLSSASDVSQSNQNGLAAGSVTDLYTAPNTGEVYVVYSNGLKARAGQLAVARFTNPSGLMRAGGNMYEAGLNSGDAMVGAAGTGGRGLIAANSLEASNVDMAQEFTNMILAQRGFQASSRVISTSDEILQELVNLKR
jgi:flagellar hook protein FlgE